MINAVITRGQQVRPESTLTKHQQLMVFNLQQRPHRPLDLQQQQLFQPQVQPQLQPQTQPQTQPQLQIQQSQPQQQSDTRFIPITFQNNNNENQIVNQFQYIDPYQQNVLNSFHFGQQRLRPAQSLSKYNTNEFEYIREFAWNLFQVRKRKCLTILLYGIW